jgi:hypothetical protein
MCGRSSIQLQKIFFLRSIVAVVRVVLVGLVEEVVSLVRHKRLLTDVC